MDRPKLKEGGVKLLYDARFLKLYGLEYDSTPHGYLEASRRSIDERAALKSDEEMRNALPDAVTCIVILKIKGQEPKLCLQDEFRYPAGRFLLSPPAGLIDRADRESPDPMVTAARREIREEIGLELKPTDRVFVAAPFFYSSPGMTDEANGMVCAVAELDEPPCLNSDGAEGIECFQNYYLIDRAEALEMIRSCRDRSGAFFSVYTWCALAYFVSGAWE
jgi:ADP-ribose pyrophosphatase